MIKKVVLIRHAEREDMVNPDWVHTSPESYDPPLSARGAEQASELAASLAAEFDGIFGEWMTPDYFENGPPPDDNHSSLAASSYNWIIRDARSVAPFVDFVYDYEALGSAGTYGETWGEMYDRATDGIDAAIASESSSVLLVVTHGSLCNSILGHLKKSTEVRKIELASWEAVDL